MFLMDINFYFYIYLFSFSLFSLLQVKLNKSEKGCLGKKLKLNIYFLNIVILFQLTFI